MGRKSELEILHEVCLASVNIPSLKSSSNLSYMTPTQQTIQRNEID